MENWNDEHSVYLDEFTAETEEERGKFINAMIEIINNPDINFHDKIIIIRQVSQNVFLENEYYRSFSK